MIALARDISIVDLQFTGRAGIIASAVLDTADGMALVDPGPTTCLPVLRSAFERSGRAVADLRAILLTHVHLDHAAATGSLVRENPAIRVYVHDRGVRHLVDPTRLLASAKRLYGTELERLFGEFLPVPAESIHSLSDGEWLTFGNRRLEVAYTPGHASHHVSYFDTGTDIAFVGDTAGIRIGAMGFVMPPTPPPDIDLEAWAASAARIEAWRPSALFLTHFGFAEGDARLHFQQLLQRLHDLADLAKTTLETNASDGERLGHFVRDAAKYMRQHMPEAEATRYETASALDLCWLGLARYWRKEAA